MPSFDVVSEVNLAEVANAVLQTRKELQTRFDFKGSEWDIEEKKDQLIIHAENDFKLKALVDILMGKLAKRNVSLKNIELKKVELSSVGRARQEITIKQGFETDVAKDMTTKIRGTGLKVQAQIQEKKLRVTGKSRDDLQEVMGFLRKQEWSVAIAFDNFRD